jgi:hypothetical protein
LGLEKDDVKIKGVSVFLVIFCFMVKWFDFFGQLTFLPVAALVCVASPASVTMGCGDG